LDRLALRAASCIAEAAQDRFKEVGLEVSSLEPPSLVEQGPVQCGAHEAYDDGVRQAGTDGSGLHGLEAVLALAAVQKRCCARPSINAQKMRCGAGGSLTPLEQRQSITKDPLSELVTK